MLQWNMENKSTKEAIIEFLKNNKGKLALTGAALVALPLLGPAPTAALATDILVASGVTLASGCIADYVKDKSKGFADKFRGKCQTNDVSIDQGNDAFAALINKTQGLEPAMEM
jgi:hypothetical protein